MEFNQTTIEKLAKSYLEMEISVCPRLDPLFNSDDKIMAWDGEIHLFADSSFKTANFLGRCPVQVKGHIVDEVELKKNMISFTVGIDTLKAYQKDGGVLFFVVYISDKENDRKYKIFYNEFLPVDIGNILAAIEPSQKTKNLKLFPFPKDTQAREALVWQFIRDKTMQHGTACEYPIQLQDELSKGGTFAFWAPADFSFIGSKRPTYLYKKELGEHTSYFPIGRVQFDSLAADNVPMKVCLDGEVYFENARIEIRSKGKIKSVLFNRGLSLGNIGKNKTVKLRMTQKCSVAEYLKNLKFVLGLSKGKQMTIEGFASGDTFHFDCPIETIEDEISYMERINQLLQILHVTKPVDVKKLTKKNMNDLQFLYRAIVEKNHFEMNGDLESVMGTYTVGPYKFLMLRLLDNEHKVVYHDGFDTEGLHFEITDNQDNKHPSSIYAQMKKQDILTFDNIYYPEIVRSVTEVPYSEIYGFLVNRLVLEMLDAYDISANKELLNAVMEISRWLYEHDNTTVNYLNMMQTIRRSRSFTTEEESNIMDYRGKETDNFMLAGFAAVLGNITDYKYYLKKISEEQRKQFLMFPIKNLVKEV